MLPYTRWAISDMSTRPALLAALGHLQRGALSLREACVPAPPAATLAATLHAQQVGNPSMLPGGDRPRGCCRM